MIKQMNDKRRNALRLLDEWAKSDEDRNVAFAVTLENNSFIPYINGTIEDLCMLLSIAAYKEPCLKEVLKSVVELLPEVEKLMDKENKYSE